MPAFAGMTNPAASETQLPSVNPAKAGILAFQRILDPGFRRSEGTLIGYFLLWTRT